MNRDRDGGHSRHLFKAFLSALLVAFFMMPFAWFGSNAVRAEDSKQGDRDRLGDLQDQTRELNKKIRENQKAAEQKQKEASTIKGQISRLEDDIDQTEQKIQETDEQVRQTESEIKIAEEEIAQRQRELDEQKRNQDETLRVLYETSEQELLFIIAGSDSISEVIEHNEYLESLEYRIDATLHEIDALKREVEQKKSDLDGKYQELKGLQAQQEAYKAGLANEQSRKAVLLVETKEQQESYESAVDEAKKLNAQVESEMALVRSRLTKASGPGVLQARDRGTSNVGFQWPTDYRYISTYFGGSTPFQPNGGHGGLDLVNSAGTPIYAASDGTVTTVTEMTYNGKLYAYGKYIVIGHNARWSSLYGHLQSFVVASGDEVKRGDIIGYMGSTGWSTGPHLHFEIWEYSSRANPLDYLP